MTNTQQGQWVPVEDGQPLESQHTTYYGDVVYEMVNQDKGNLLVANGPSEYNHTALAVFTLPDNLRLCQWQPAAQGVRVPSEIHETILAALSQVNGYFPHRQQAMEWIDNLAEKGGI